MITEHHSHHAMPVRTLYIVFAALLGLLFLTVGAAYLKLDRLAVPIAFTIATIKAALIVWYFMHVKFGSKLIILFATGAIAWAVILLVWTSNDYATRDLVGVVGK
jgi:cytochrome c oxidase subunit 4